jgi:hypothetical protein
MNGNSSTSSFEQALFEEANKVQVGNGVNIPKLNVANLPQGNFTWSPKSSDSGETETDDVSNQHESILNAAQQHGATNAGATAAAGGRMGHEESSFFNLPAHPSDLQELEQTPPPANVFDFNRSMRSSPLGEEFAPGSSYPPSTAQFKPGSYEAAHFPAELGYPEPSAAPRAGITMAPPGVDPKVSFELYFHFRISHLAIFSLIHSCMSDTSSIKC